MTCDKGVMVYGARDINIQQTKLAILQGWRNEQELWMVPLVPLEDALKHLDLATNMYKLPSTVEVVRFLHVALGFPMKQTLLTAVRKGNLATFSGLMVENINKFFPESDEVQKGHMRQHKQGIRSTKVTDKDSAFTFNLMPGVKHKYVYLHVFDVTKKAMYTDQTGRFLIMLSRRNKYLMVTVEMDGSYIDPELLKSRNTRDLIGTYHSIYN